MQNWRERLRKAMQFSVRDTAVTLGILAATTGLSYVLQVFDKNSNYVSMLFVLAVFLIARMTQGYFYGIAASLGSVLLVNFLFTYPYFRFNFTLSGYPIAILSMLAVSDDLRTPLTGILGASSAILENDEQLSREERLSLLRDVRDDAQWLIRMVENLLTITRMDDSNGARVAKSPEAGEEVLETAAVKFRKQFPDWKLTVQAPEEFLLIPMDAVLIGQVLMNLLENAVDHAAGGDQIWLSLERQGDMAVFTVRDNGCGLDVGLLPKIFEGKASAGSSGDRKRNMGIGLSVCNTIIRAHGGTMEAQNAPQGGAVFCFALPLEEEAYE